MGSAKQVKWSFTSKKIGDKKYEVRMTATINGTVSAATKYYPLFYQITSSNQVPSFTTSTTRLSANVAIGTSATTSATPSYYLWMAHHQLIQEL